MKKNQILNLFILILSTALTVLAVIAFALSQSNISKAEQLTPTENEDNSVDETKVSLLGDISNIDYYIPEYDDRYYAYLQKNLDLDIATVIKYVNIGLDYDYYKNKKLIKDPNSLHVLVNKYNYFDETFIPGELTKINIKYATNYNQQLRKDAVIAFEDMAKVAASDNIRIRAMSAYRTYNYQENLYNNYVKNHGEYQANLFSAKAGHSEHQSGLAVDVDNVAKSYSSFASTKAYLWMKDNAHRFGFILRYPENKTHITGYSFEAWHYRYVGVETAKYIYENDLTFDEYIATKKR